MDSDNALLRIRNRLLGRIRRTVEPSMPEPAATLSGQAVAANRLDDLYLAFTRPDADLLAVFNDMRDMDDSLTEVSTPLDILSEDSMEPDPDQPWPFRVMFQEPGGAAEDVVNDLFRRLSLQLVDLAREALLMGNDFRQVGITKDFQIVQLMYLAPETMRVQTDEHGNLNSKPKSGDPTTWAYAQYVNENLTAVYWPWEIMHTAWHKRGGSAYGTPLYSTARWPWRKLVAMEDALVLNWLTRAFARLVFILDVTGKSEAEAASFIKKFRAELQTAQVGVDRSSKAMSIVRDIMIGRGYHEMSGGVHEGLTDVKVLDTAGSAFSDMTPVKYYQDKILMSGRVPRAYLGLEENINAKATLVAEDRKYAKTLQTVQSMVGVSLISLAKLQLALDGLNPADHFFWLLWNNPSRADIVDMSAALQQFAQADQIFAGMGVVDPEFIATRHIGMSQADWQRVMDNLKDNFRPTVGGDNENS